MSSNKWRAAVVAAAVALPATLVLAVGGERDGGAAGGRPSGGSASSSGAVDGGADVIYHEKDASPDPTISAVMPQGGAPDRAVRIALLGTGFGEPGLLKPIVTFGPGGAAGAPADAAVDAAMPDRCTDVDVVSERLLHCTLPAGLKARDAQRFIVSVLEPDGQWHSSDPSTGTYTPSGELKADVWSVEAECGSLGCVSPGVDPGKLAAVRAQIRLTGSFGPTDAGAPKVDFAPIAADGGKYPCDPIMLVNSTELVCYLSQAVYRWRTPIPALANDEFQVVPRQP